MRYEPAIDLEAARAIDVHVHVHHDAAGRTSLPQRLLDGMAAYFGDAPDLDIDGLADYYRERGIVAVVFTVDARTALGVEPNSSIEIAEGAARNSDVLVPFGSVDPHLGDEAVEEARRLVEDHGVRGFKFHPSVQAFDPSDVRFFPLWHAVSDLRVPALFHTGQTGVGAGLPGGGGVRLRFSNPMLLDDVAAEFPELAIVLAHPSVPWQDEALSMATHKSNVHIDLSGWSPKYFPDNLVRQAGSILRHKVLFGSDFPALTPDRWLEDFAALPIRDDVRPGILKHNAAALLGLV